MKSLVCFAYLCAMTLANVLVAGLGPWVIPLNSFVLIGFDLSARDWLQVRLTTGEMLGLIAAGAVLTLVAAPDAGRIALASAGSFAASSLVDWAAFSRSPFASWKGRARWSNLWGAAADSVFFPLLAFGGVSPWLFAAQFCAKALGSLAWVEVLSKVRGRS